MTSHRGMKTFGIVWIGQLISILGTQLMGFALSIWLYQETGSATTFAISLLFNVLPNILVSPIAGALVDRWNRRWVMILSDIGAGLGTLTIALLMRNGQLAVWHIYLFNSLAATLNAFQQPAYTASITLLVPREVYGRASGMVQMGQAFGQIVAPLLAGVLVARIGPSGVILIDVATAAFAVCTLLWVQIPQPAPSVGGEEQRTSLRQQIAFGWFYLADRPGLMGLLGLFAIVNFLLGVFNALLLPLLLSLVSPEIMGRLISISGVGMLMGSVVMSAWGGPQRRILGVLGFIALAGAGYAITGLSASPIVITAGIFLIMFSIPIAGGSSQAIWQSKVAPDVQGRVFALRSMVSTSAMPLAYVTAGPLADRLFEPLMATEGALAGSLGPLLGTGPGRGIGLMFVTMGLLIGVACFLSYFHPRIRNVEDELPDVVTEQPEFREVREGTPAVGALEGA